MFRGGRGRVGTEEPAQQPSREEQANRASAGLAFRNRSSMKGDDETDAEAPTSVTSDEVQEIPASSKGDTAETVAPAVPVRGDVGGHYAPPGASVPAAKQSPRRGAASQISTIRRLSCQLLRPTMQVDNRKSSVPKADLVSRGRVRQIKVSDHKVATTAHADADSVATKEGSYLTELLTEKERKSVVLPNSRLKNTWDAVIAVLVIWTALMLPIQLCFDNVDETLPAVLTAFDVFTDIIFISDIILNFHVGFIVDAVVIVDKVSIRKKYFRRWFPIDLVGSFPGDTIWVIAEAINPSLAASSAATGNSSSAGAAATTGGGNGAEAAAFANLFKILKVPKLMRLGRLLKSLEKLDGAANVANIIVLLLIMVVANHWIACLWFLVTKQNSLSGWVASAGLDGRTWTSQYPKVYYTTLMMVMGDSIDDINDSEFIIASFVVIVGITMNATIFASIASYAAQISADTAQHKNKMNSVQRSISSLKLPQGLSNRIQQYYEYCWLRHRDFSAQALLDELPDVFQRRCAFIVHEQKLRRFGPFAQADERFVAALSTKLHPEVYMPEAYILVAGQVYSSAYFIQRGLVQVTWAATTRDTVNVLTIDDYFGELSLFVNKKLAYTARSITYLDAFRLDRADFMLVMRSHPAGAVHVADLMEAVLPAKLAQQVTREIYDYSGLRELLSFLLPGTGKWRPSRGLAVKLRRFAAENEHVLARIRARSRRKSKFPDEGGDHRSRFQSVLPNGTHAPAHADDEDAYTGGGEGGGGALAGQVAELSRSHARLAERVESGHARLEQKMEQLCQLIKAGSLTKASAPDARPARPMSAAVPAHVNEEAANRALDHDDVAEITANSSGAPTPR